MINHTIDSLKCPIIARKIRIKVFNYDNIEVGDLQDNLDLLNDTDYPRFQPNHYVVVENPNFDIMFTSNYINLWKESRKKSMSGKTPPKNNKSEKEEGPQDKFR